MNRTRVREGRPNTAEVTSAKSQALQPDLGPLADFFAGDSYAVVPVNARAFVALGDGLVQAGLRSEIEHVTWNADAEDSTWGEFVIRIRGGFRPGSDDWEAAMDRFIAVRRSVSLEHPEFADYLADTFALEL